jgi:hypothetical protein
MQTLRIMWTIIFTSCTFVKTLPCHSICSPCQAEREFVEVWQGRRLHFVFTENRRNENFLHESKHPPPPSHYHFSLRLHYGNCSNCKVWKSGVRDEYSITKKEETSRPRVHLTKPVRIKWIFQSIHKFEFSFLTNVFLE